MPPVINRLEPKSGPIGSAIVIYGQNLRGAVAVASFAGVESDVLPPSAAQLSVPELHDTVTATVPVGAVSGEVVVVVDGVPSNGSLFSVTP